MFRFYSKPTETNGVRVAVVAEHSEGVLKVAIARCSTKDHYDKRVGRALAEKRLTENELYASIPIQVCDVKTFVLFAKGVAAEVSKDPTKVSKKQDKKTN